MRTMEKMIDTGKMRHIGVSNFTLNLLKRAQGILSKYEILISLPLNKHTRGMIDYKFLSSVKGNIYNMFQSIN